MKYQYSKSPLFSALDFNRKPPSIANLDPALTINGQTVYPTLRYKGQDATATTWPAWGYGETLSIAGAGASPTLNAGSPLMGSVDDSVKFNMSKYYSGGLMGISTEDFVIEILVLQGSSFSSQRVFGSLISLGGGKYRGIELYQSGSWLIFQVADGLSLGSVATAATLNGMYHLLLFVDVSSGAGCAYSNGVSATGTIPNSGSFESGSNFLMGCGPIGGFVFTGHIFYYSQWKANNWLNTHLQPEIAKDRFNRLTGIYPNQNRGATPTITYSRASSAFLEKNTTTTPTLYQVGSGWPRVNQQLDASGKTVVGYLAEPASTNLCLRSEEFFNSAAWAEAELTDTWSATASPVVTSSGTCRQLAMLTNAQVYCAPLIGVLDNKTYTASIYARRVSGGTQVYISQGSIYGVLKQTIRAISSSWSRYTSTLIYPVPSSSYASFLFGTKGYLGNPNLPAITVELWGAQLEEKPFATSYIPTTTATVARAADVLYYKGDDGNANSGSNNRLSYTITTVSGFLAGTDSISSIYGMSMNVSGTSTAKIDSIIYPSAIRGAGTILTSGGTTTTISGNTVAIWDGKKHTIDTVWCPSCIGLYSDYNNEAITPVSSVPYSFDRINIGSDYNSANQPNAIISDVKIYNSPIVRKI
jgi:hypothetical protein